jgi:hypothetical protein
MMPPMATAARIGAVEISTDVRGPAKGAADGEA